MMSHEAIPTSLRHPAARHTLEWTLHWLFRLALWGEFVGHGAFGVMTKQAWVHYFTLFGFPEAWAWTLMPVVGSVDITLGVLALIAPTRAGLLYMAWWGLFTASLRPLVGEGGWEFLERSYNFGAPFLVLWVHGWDTHIRSWFTVITKIPRVTVARAQTTQWGLRGIMAGMLIGHGAFGLVMGKPTLLPLYDAAGFGAFGVPLPSVSAAIGAFEMLLGLLCLEVQVATFFLFVCTWKLGTELLYVPAQTYGAWWEVLERGSSYAAPLLSIGMQQVLTAYGLPAQGLIPRRWLRALGRAPRHAEVRLPSSWPPQRWAAAPLGRCPRQIARLSRSGVVEITQVLCDAENDKNIRWTREFWEAMRPYESEAAYVNYLDSDEPDRIRAVYGETYERLVALKNMYDPTNLFRRNQNIKPTV